MIFFSFSQVVSPLLRIKNVSKKKTNSSSNESSDGIAKDVNNMSLDRIDSLLGRVKAAQREAGRAIVECARNANSDMKK